MNNSIQPKFRENATVAVVRDAVGICIHVRGIPDTIKLEFAKLSDAVRSEALGYGMEVRLTRAAAIERDTKSGKSASPQDKFDAIKRLADHYASGTDAWSMVSAGGGGLSTDTRVLVEALVRAFNLSPDVAEEQVRELSSAERDALRIDDEVKPHLDAIYAERGKAAGGLAKGLIEKLKARG